MGIGSVGRNVKRAAWFAAVELRNTQALVASAPSKKEAAIRWVYGATDVVDAAKRGFDAGKLIR